MLQPVGRGQPDFQPATLTELCATLLKIIAIAAFVFGVIFGSKHWILVGAVSGILSIAAYVYSQSSSNETWEDWVKRVLFNTRRSPHLTPPSPLRPPYLDAGWTTPHHFQFTPVAASPSTESLFAVNERGDGTTTPPRVNRQLIYSPGDE